MVWGVFSDFFNILLEDVLKYPLSYADGYLRFWKKPVTLQHSLVEMELVAWESNCTLCIAKNEVIIDEFLSLYSQAENLENITTDSIFVRLCRARFLEGETCHHLVFNSHIL